MKNKFLMLRKKLIETEFHKMNDMQQQAVFSVEGPVLVLAGAGSGKTTVLVNRIANILKYGNAYHSEDVYCTIDEELLYEMEEAISSGGASDELAKKISVSRAMPWQILSITFTNKAANEMKERLSLMLGEKALDIKAGTFHSICAKMLRRNADRLGYKSSFTIYDTADMKRIIKDSLEDLSIGSKQFEPKALLSAISGAKNRMMSPEDFAQQAGNDYYLGTVKKVYEKYQHKLKSANAMDFDDLLLNTVKLLQENDDLLDYYQNLFKYILIDEYQDTNPVQYELVRLLSDKYRNLCVVGDDDQSIYRFRGATIENILSFEKTFPDAKTIRLEQNYRSTQNILDAANKVISNNRERKGKNLWTENGRGDKIVYCNCQGEREEAKFVADEIEKNVLLGGKYSDNSVLYRMNAQSNAVESYFVRAGIPYRIIGGHKFYDRAEIKDVLAYLRILVNPDDIVSLKRVINTPKRGIGDSSVSKLEQIALQTGESFLHIADTADEYAVLSRAASKIKEFSLLISELSEMAETASPSQVYNAMLDKSGYLQYLSAMGDEGITKKENVMELLSNIIKYEEENADPTLYGFLEEVSLLTDIDNYDADADAVTLMTVHSAKGLEFDNVFIVGLEEGIFPSDRSKYEGESEIEEERRTAYVAYTRARHKLYITTAKQRFIMGRTEFHQPSRFFDEIPSELIEDCSPRSMGRNISSFNIGSVPEKKTYIPRATVGTTQSKPSGSTQSFIIGERVKHPVFGEGMINKITEMGSDLMLEIAFDSVGTKKVMKNYVKLEKI